MSLQQRTIRNIWNVVPQPGQGPHIQVGHVLPQGRWEEFDPFLIMAEDWFQQNTFGPHPHRGMETVTYVIDGKLRHKDSFGGEGVLNPGDVQWMTAGRGLIHLEDPLPGETVHSLQLWVNLPKDNKMAEPRYQDLRSADVPVRHENGAVIRVFSGASGGVNSDTSNYTPVTFVELSLEAGASVKQDLPGGYNGFVYILEGSGSFGPEETKGEAKQVLWLAPADASSDSEIAIQAHSPMRALLIAGQPLREPVVAYGPFVMNSQGEIKQSMIDYQAGKFGSL